MNKHFRHRTRTVYNRHHQRVIGLRNHPFVLPVLLFLALFFISSVAMVGLNGRTVGADDSRVVQLSIDGDPQTVPTRADTVDELLNRLNVEVDEHDIVEPSLETPIESDNFRINVYTARPVTVVDDKGVKVTVLSAHQEPRQVAEKAGVKLYPEDKVERQRAEVVDPTEILRDGVVAEKVVIDRAIPVVINLYGNQIPVRTHATTVEELLKEKDIKLLEGDVLSLAVDSELTDNASLVIVRMGSQIDTREEMIAMTTETVSDPSLAAGRSVIKQQGSPGKRIVTYEVELQNDVEVARKVLQEVIVIEPVTHIVTRGTKLTVPVVVSGDKGQILSAAGLNPSDHGYADYIFGRESGWRVNAQNPGGCIGLGQRCPYGGVNRLLQACPDWETNAVCQIRHFNQYALDVYGSWERAYTVWLVQHWW